MSARCFCGRIDFAAMSNCDKTKAAHALSTLQDMSTGGLLQFVIYRERATRMQPKRDKIHKLAQGEDPVICRMLLDLD
jgi:hypothetical protein